MWVPQLPPVIEFREVARPDPGVFARPWRWYWEECPAAGEAPPGSDEPPTPLIPAILGPIGLW